MPIYKIVSNTGPRHTPLFKFAVKLTDTKFYISTGKSKKDAEQNAAVLCLQSMSKLWIGTIPVFYFLKIDIMKIL